jgi:hypothetical protein
MFNFLKNHPFAVEAFFENSTVLTFAVPKEDIKNLIPNCLALDTFNDKWAFIAVAMVQTKYLRPKGFPKFFGNDFFLIGFRIFVRYTNLAGKNLRGLYILKSETDKKKMEYLGNIFTKYNYKTTDISKFVDNNNTIISSKKSSFQLEFKSSDSEIALPEFSPFANWKEARKFAGPLPFTFSFDNKTNKLLIIEGQRANWTPKPIEVLGQHFSFLDSLNLKNMVLANAFEIKDIPYIWKKGKIEQWGS